MFNTLCLFSGGKDSVMALMEEINSGDNCVALIATNNHHAQLSDGPEVNSDIAIALAKELFNIPVFTLETTAKNFKRELSEKIDVLISDEDISRIVTGDLNHPDGIIHYLKSNLASKHPSVSFFSIGEKYLENGTLNKERYLNDIFSQIEICIIGVRLPDFAEIKEGIIGRNLDQVLVDELRRHNIDPLGEDGEYQSLLLNVKNVKKKLRIKNYETVIRSGRDTKNYQYLVQNIKDWEID